MIRALVYLLAITIAEAIVILLEPVAGIVNSFHYRNSLPYCHTGGSDNRCRPD
jgi:hypothetical protein